MATPWDREEPERLACGYCAGPNQATLFCRDCKAAFCFECDAQVHVRVLSSHKRVHLEQRPATCRIHDQEAQSYCLKDKRFACASCLSPVPPGPCNKHHDQVHVLKEAAKRTRTSLYAIAAFFQEDQQILATEIAGLQTLLGVVGERLKSLYTASTRAQQCEGRLKVACARSDQQLLQEAAESEKKALSLRADILATLGNDEASLATWQQRLQVALQPRMLASMGAVTAWAAVVPGTPDLDKLSPPCRVADPGAPNAMPISLCASRDGAVVVADRSLAAAWLLLPGAYKAQELHACTANASFVEPIEGDPAKGFVLVFTAMGFIQRSAADGTATWRRTRLRGPTCALTLGDTVHVAESAASCIARFNLHDGTALSPIGVGSLCTPVSLALGPAGVLLVADEGKKAIIVMDELGTVIRSLGQTLLQSPCGVCVDGRGRVYVADRALNAIVVLNMDGGEHATARIPLGEAVAPTAVLVAQGGEIVVCAQSAAASAPPALPPSFMALAAAISGGKSASTNSVFGAPPAAATAAAAVFGGKNTTAASVFGAAAPATATATAFGAAAPAATASGGLGAPWSLSSSSSSSSFGSVPQPQPTTTAAQTAAAGFGSGTGTDQALQHSAPGLHGFGSAPPPGKRAGRLSSKIPPSSTPFAFATTSGAAGVIGGPDATDPLPRSGDSFAAGWHSSIFANANTTAAATTTAPPSWLVIIRSARETGADGKTGTVGVDAAESEEDEEGHDECPAPGRDGGAAHANSAAK